MIKVIMEANAAENAALLEEMFLARKRLFVDCLGWDAAVDDAGREIDRFDGLSPVYLIDIDARNRHRGSVRLLPTMGETVLGDRVAAVLGGMPVRSPEIWESTRFCVASGGSHDVDAVAITLMLGICEACLVAGVDRVIGSFDERMAGLYARGGWSPDLLGSSEIDKRAVYLGIWEVDEASIAALRDAAGIGGPVLEPASALPLLINRPRDRPKRPPARRPRRPAARRD